MTHQKGGVWRRAAIGNGFLAGNRTRRARVELVCFVYLVSFLQQKNQINQITVFFYWRTVSSSHLKNREGQAGGEVTTVRIRWRMNCCRSFFV